MSTPPRDAGIPMLTEVIDEPGMAPADLAGPAPDAAVDEPPLLMEQIDDPGSAPARLQHPPDAAAPHAPPPGPSYAARSQPAPAYPLPLRPAAPAGAAPSPPAPPGPRPNAGSAVEPPLPAPDLPNAISDEEWQRMERRVRERILGQLLSRTDAMLEERIRSSLAGVLEQAVDGLAATLRASLHKTLEDVVSRAVAQEITRLQSSKK